MTTPRDWDAATYDRVADPMTRWGAAVLDRLPLRGDERVPEIHSSTRSHRPCPPRIDYVRLNILARRRLP